MKRVVLKTSLCVLIVCMFFIPSVVMGFRSENKEEQFFEMGGKGTYVDLGFHNLGGSIGELLTWGGFK